MFNSFYAQTYNPVCKYSSFVECDHPSAIIATIFTIIIVLLNLYAGTILMRQTKLTWRINFPPGVGLCPCNAFVEISLLLIHFIFQDISSSDLQTTFSKLAFIPGDVKKIARCLYFAQISNVLSIFGISGSKIIYALTVILRYYFTLVVVVKVLCLWIPFTIDGKFSIFLYSKLQYVHSEIISNTLICISLIILSLVFILSNIKNFMPRKLDIPIKVALFLVAFFFIVNILIDEYYNTLGFNSLIYTNISKFLYLDAFLFYISALLDVDILAIIMMLSIPEMDNGSEAGKQSIDNVLSQTVEPEITI